MNAAQDKKEEPPKAKAKKKGGFEQYVTIERTNTKTGETIRVIKDVPAMKIELKDKADSPAWHLNSREAKIAPLKGDRIIEADGTVWEITKTSNSATADGRFIVDSKKTDREANKDNLPKKGAPDPDGSLPSKK